MGRFSVPRLSAHSYSLFYLPSTYWTRRMQVENMKWGTVPQILFWSLGTLQGCRYVPLSTFGIQSPYSLLRISARQDGLNKLLKAPGVFSDCALALSEEWLAVVDLHIRHPPARGTPNLPLSAKSPSAVRNVSDAREGKGFPEQC